METRDHPTPRADDLDISSLSPSCWRVGDRRLAGLPGISLLGFIDHNVDCYQVTRFDSPSHQAVYANLDDAVADFARGSGGREFVHTIA